MRLNSPTQVRKLLEERGIAPSKVLGQNFLIDGNIRNVILDAAGLTADDHVLEIGPGLGMLTEGLLERAGRVTVIEKDDLLARFLVQDFAVAIDEGRMTLIHADALDVDLSGFVAKGARKVLSNLPYSVGNRILVDLSRGESVPDAITIMVQRDVAERIVSGPGTKEYGVLSVLLQLRYAARIVKHVSPKCFVPAPRVWSSIVQLQRNDEYNDQLDDSNLFLRLVKHCFSLRRKQLQSSLAKMPGGMNKETAKRVLAECAIDETARPETLSVAQWVGLCNALPK